MHLPLLFPLAVVPISVSALLRCTSIGWDQRNPFPPGPPPEDCLAIASHIPQALHTSGGAEAHYLSSPDSPFFPRAIFVHGKCTIRISYSTEPPPPYDFLSPVSTGDQIFNKQQLTPSTPLSVASIAKIWHVARWSIRDVIVECLAKGRPGWERAFVDIPEVDGVWYLVQVMGHIPGGWAQRAIAQERAALMHAPMSPQQDAHPALTNQYKMTIWEVP